MARMKTIYNAVGLLLLPGSALFLYFAVLLVPEAHSQAAVSTVICRKNSTGKIVLRQRRCRSGETKLNNISQLTGASGANGADGMNGSNGEDGSIRIYGDGSEGALTVSSSQSLIPVGNQFTNVIINAGQTLTVESGTVLRLTGNFTNNGTITVNSYAAGAFLVISPTASNTVPSVAPAGNGVAAAPGSIGAFGTDAVLLVGGSIGIGMAEAVARNLLHPGVLGGSGGGSAFSGEGGGGGGGSFVVLAEGAVVNNGVIQALGTSVIQGGGGGGGGIVILASRTSVTNSNTGTISVAGGSGSPSTASNGAGGGGGGGIIHLMSPTTPTNTGTLTVAGGAAGSNAIAVTDSPRIAGAGGGSCYGAGGSGASVTTGNVSQSNSAGNSGISILTTADPTSLF